MPSDTVTTLYKTVILHSQVAYSSDNQYNIWKHNVAFYFMTLRGYHWSGKTSCLHDQVWHVNGSIKGKVVPVHTMKIYKGSKGSAPLILNLGTTRTRAVNFTPWPIYPRGKNASTHWIGGWVGHSASLNVLDKRKISWPSQDSNPRLSSPQLSHYTSKRSIFFQNSDIH